MLCEAHARVVSARARLHPQSAEGAGACLSHVWSFRQCGCPAVQELPELIIKQLTAAVVAGVVGGLVCPACLVLRLVAMLWLLLCEQDW